MTGGELYLEKQAKRRRKEYLEALPSPRLLPLEDGCLSLQHAPMRFRQRLHDILHHPAGDDSTAEESRIQLGKVVFETVDVASFDAAAAGIRDIGSLGGHAATVIGSSQQGKTSLLNSLLNLFGFVFKEGLTFPESADLLPTHSKNRVGLPFPLRLEYGPKYELHLRRWETPGLHELMRMAAEKALARNDDFFEDLETGFESVAAGSFLEFVAQHGEVDQQLGYVPKSSARETLEADGGLECPDLASDGVLNPSLDIHKAVPRFLVKLVEDGCWYRYEHVTLKCPSQLLKHLSTGLEATNYSYVLDLPGVGIVDDNNSLVEELVLRDVRDANTIIVLTGERSFTQDILHILKNSVFERLLDPDVAPPPTVAVTNSRNLRGLKEEEMDVWRAATLDGSLGWNREVAAFAEEMFTERRHRDLGSVQPELFPNDLTGFLESRTGADEKGVSMLVGYFLRLPQESLIARVTDVRERARSVMQLVDQLWQADKVSWSGLHSSRLMKEAKRLRDEEFQKNLDAQLTLASQKKMFGFEVESFSSNGQSKTLQTQLDYIDDLFSQQVKKLDQRFEKLKNGRGDMKQDLPRIVKEALLQIASQWDANVGNQAFDSFLSHGKEISRSIFQQWARKIFHVGERESMGNQKQDQACKFMVNYLNGTASAAMDSGTFKYTWTHWLRLQAWNLDLKDITKMLGVRRGRSASAAYNQVWLSVKELMKAKRNLFKEQMLEHMSLQSTSIKQLVLHLKKVIKNTFEDCDKNFAVVMDALERIAKGGLAISEDPVVVLREQLQNFVEELERYLAKHRNMRDIFGAQELKKVLQTQAQHKDLLPLKVQAKAS